MVPPATASSLWSASDNDIYYTDGRVGVGTDNPDYSLHAVDASGGPAIVGQNLGEPTMGQLGTAHTGVSGEGSTGVKGTSSNTIVNE